jgi:hypothetical protein
MELERIPAGLRLKNNPYSPVVAGTPDVNFIPFRGILNHSKVFAPGGELSSCQKGGRWALYAEYL